DNDLEIIPVINKIDLPNADPDRVAKELEEVIGINPDEVILASAKENIGIEDILERVVDQVPPPEGDKKHTLQALIFDSLYDPYRGVVVYICVKEGEVNVGDTIEMMATGKAYEVTELGVCNRSPVGKKSLTTGEVGYLTASIKEVKDTRVCDTITTKENGADTPLPGYRRLNPMVFCGLYPVNAADYNPLRDALERLELNDSSLQYDSETSQALGFGFRTGFLGLLHMEIIQERIEREFNIDLITTAPSVVYEVRKTDEETVYVDNPSDMPDEQTIEEILEPFVKASVMVPNDFVGPVMELCQSKRGQFLDMQYLDDIRVNVVYEIPLSEIVYDFFDQLKSQTKGYASLDYEFIGNRSSNLVKMDILLNGEPIDALSIIVHKDFSYNRGKQIVEKLKELIPRQQFEVPVQAAIGNHIVARSNIKAVRKDVTAKLYGGD